MIDLLKLRIEQGRQYLDNLAGASLSESFRGFPELDGERCTECEICIRGCPTGAVSLAPLKIDLGACIFCGACERACPEEAIHFTAEHRLSATSRAALVVTAGMRSSDYINSAIEPRPDIAALFKRSLKLRSVSAGGCNACELELQAITNVNFDAARFGIDIVASPRHADMVVVSGPVTENMADALERTIQATPEPRGIILYGACAVSGGVFRGSPALARSVLGRHRIDLFVPGSPPHPLTLLHGLLALLNRRPRGRATRRQG